MNRDEAIQAAQEPIDWSGAEVETTPRKVTMVYSTRLPDDLSRWLVEEASRRGTNPSVILRELVAEGKRAAAEDRMITVRLSDLHRAINHAADGTARDR
ncbi:hypothetical protein GKC29_03270 [Micromonospora sp. WMMC415]|uniref:hypothetical protein n=1 Tax=Micromonospora sp. WMMC415 TaxID=2675222 RepID=UPI0012B46F3C|nr:hypothetical protein [Micromonospora sp. WMMC415]QGN45966.1 hypothetical protein GKC29_03270 [Micromonospora sp. WMMC415]